MHATKSRSKNDQKRTSLWPVITVKVSKDKEKILRQKYEVLSFLWCCNRLPHTETAQTLYPREAAVQHGLLPVPFSLAWWSQGSWCLPPPPPPRGELPLPCAQPSGTHQGLFGRQPHGALMTIPSTAVHYGTCPADHGTVWHCRVAFAALAELLCFAQLCTCRRLLAFPPSLSLFSRCWVGPAFCYSSATVLFHFTAQVFNWQG